MVYGRDYNRDCCKCRVPMVMEEIRPGRNLEREIIKNSITMKETGYVHGSKMIVFVGGKALGHCTSCEIQDQAETKSRSLKVLPDYSDAEEADEDLKPSAGEDTSTDGLWDEKSVSKRSVSISTDCLVCKDETGSNYDELLEAMDSGKPVKLKYAYAGEESKKYRVGMFVITSLQRNDPADDDSNYSASFENTGKVRTKKVAE